MSDTQQQSEQAANDAEEAPEQQPAEQHEQEQEQTFTQADVDRIVKERAERLYRQRVGDVDIDDLKKAAKGKATAEERIAALESEIQSSKREASVRRAQAKYGISDQDAELFLTGSDDATLDAQGKRLADRMSEVEKQGNYVPREGNNPTPKPDRDREFADFLTGHS